MKILLVILSLIILTPPAYAKAYAFQYQGYGRIIIFHGNITEANEAKVKSLQTKYLESLRPTKLPSEIRLGLNPAFRQRVHLTGNYYYKQQLQKLGVNVEDVEDSYDIRSERAYPLYEYQYQYPPSPQPTSK